jgi:alkaline phosphatase D
MQVILIMLFLFIGENTFSQVIENERLVSGPMQGHTTANSTNIWLMVKNADSILVQLKDINSGSTFSQTVKLSPSLYKDFKPANFSFNNLKADNAYMVEVSINGDKVKKEFVVKTLSENIGKNFSFLIGSCALWIPRGMRWMHPGIEEWIYLDMKKADGEFMLWLGDYLYYGPKNYNSPEGMYKKQVKTRLHNLHMDFMRSRPQYSIWDDHEFGPNNSGKNFIYKKEGLDFHKMFWANPFYGETDNPGCYYNFSYQDAEYFMTDGRYYRDEEGMDTSKMLGDKQIQWLCEKLKSSKATFKFVAVGSQVLNRVTTNDSYTYFPKEKKTLFDFIEKEKITGVIFLSGDRHHTELIKIDRECAYPLFDFTNSAVTSFRRRTRKSAEFINPDRIPETLVDKQNYGRIAIEGEVGKRVCVLQTYNNRGKLEWEYRISENDLKYFK